VEGRRSARRSGHYSALIVGNLNVDLMMLGVDEQVRPGEELIVDNHVVASAGQAGYCAMALGVLDVPVAVMATVGEDAWGSRLLADLARHRVDTSHIKVCPGARTGVTVALVRRDGERGFVSDLGASRLLTPAMIDESGVSPGAWGVTAFVGLFNTPGVGVRDLAPLLRRARETGSISVFDPGWDPDGWSNDTRVDLLELLDVVDLFVPNLDEARALTGERDPLEALQSLAHHCPGTIIIKCGAAGAWARDPAGEVLHSPAHPIDGAANAVGAGDAFDAGLIFSLLEGLNLEQAVGTATRLAAYYVSRAQDRFPSRNDLGWPSAGNHAPSQEGLPTS
jgi:ribokinase